MSVYKRIKTRVYEIIGTAKKGDIPSALFDIVWSLLIVSSGVIVFVELFAPLSEAALQGLLIYEYVTVGLFGLEYLLRMWTSDIEYPNAKNRFDALIQFVTSFESLIDIISIVSVLFNEIPKEFAVLKLLKLTKLVRLVKMSDYMQNRTKKADEKIDRFKKRLYEVMSKDTEGDKLSKAYDIVSVILIFLSVAFIVTDTFDFSPGVESFLFYAEIVISVIFLLEYVLRVWLAPFEYPNLPPDKARMKYIFSFLALVDLLSILPVFFTSLPATAGVLKIFKICRIFRLVKASRYLKGFTVLGETLKGKVKTIIFSIVAIAILIVICSLIMYSFEHSAQPEVYANGFSGVYYGFQTITSLGEGAAGPITTGGKIVSAIMLLLGGCLFGVPIGIVGEGLNKMVQEQANEDEKPKPSEADSLKELAKQIAESQAKLEQTLKEIQSSVPKGEEKAEPDEPGDN